MSAPAVAESGRPKRKAAAKAISSFREEDSSSGSASSKESEEKPAPVKKARGGKKKATAEHEPAAEEKKAAGPAAEGGSGKTVKADGSAVSRGTIFEGCIFNFVKEAKFSVPVAQLKEIVTAQGGTVSNKMPFTYIINTQDLVGTSAGKNEFHLADNDIDHSSLKMRVLSEAFIHDSIKHGKRADEDAYALKSAQK